MKEVFCSDCGDPCLPVDDAWVCCVTDDACGAEWYPDHGEEYSYNDTEDSSS